MSRSIEAYDNVERIAIYDRDMDLLHPNRHRMAAVIVELLAAGSSSPARVLELGAGTGFLTSRVLQRFPRARVTALDGSSSMPPAARARLSAEGTGDRVRFVTSSFEALTADSFGPDRFDAVISSYALHHLPPEAKGRCLDAVLERLHPGGWFLNADLVAPPREDFEAVLQTVRARGIVDRNAGRDERFVDEARVRAYIESIEETEADQPQALDHELALLRDLGVADAAVFWKEYHEAVYGGRKSG